MSESVPANQLYDVVTQTTIAHPAQQATDERARRAVESQDREIRTDGGRSTSATDYEYLRSEADCQRNRGTAPVSNGAVHLSDRNSVDPQRQELTPIGRIRPSESTLAAYAVSQRLQTATMRLWSPKAITPRIKKGASNFNLCNKYHVGPWCGKFVPKHPLCTATEQSYSDSENPTRSEEGER